MATTTKAKRTMKAARQMLKDSATGRVAFIMARFRVGRTTAKGIYSMAMNGCTKFGGFRRPPRPVAEAKRIAVQSLVAGFKAW